jgi:hypothetical protein
MRGGCTCLVSVYGENLIIITIFGFFFVSAHTLYSTYRSTHAWSWHVEFIKLGAGCLDARAILIPEAENKLARAGAGAPAPCYIMWQ